MQVKKIQSITEYEIPELKRSYFMSWGDAWNPYLSDKFLLPGALQLRWLTPNLVSVLSLLSCVAASLILFSGIGAIGYILAAFLFFITPILDCLDGRIARITDNESQLGDYLDKTFDVMKIVFITMSMSFAAYDKTLNIIYWPLGFAAAFFFMFRYYIKLETIFTEQNRDIEYLEKSALERIKIYNELEKKRSNRKSIPDYVNWFFLVNYRAINLDETEFITFSVLFLLLGKPELFVILFGIGQIIIAIFRLILRGYQLSNDQEALLRPLRK